MRKSKYQKFYQVVKDAWYWTSAVRSSWYRFSVDIYEKYDEDKNPYPKKLYTITTERDFVDDEKSNNNLIEAFNSLNK